MASSNIGWDTSGLGPQDIIDRTIIFRVMNKKRYFLRADFQVHVDMLVDEKDVFGFGSPGRNDVWHLTLTSKEAKSRVMVAGDFLVDNTLVRVRSMGTDEFVARIHWLPMFIPFTTVVQELAKHGEVLSFRWEKSPGSHWAEAATLVRSVTMRGDLEKVPHLMEVGWKQHKAEALVTITGRKPLCLRCRDGGHYRKECKALYCRYCRVYGTHVTEDCKRPKTAPAYAQAVRPPTDLSEYEEPMEASQSLLTKPPFGKDTSVRGGLETPEVSSGDSAPVQGDTSVRGGHLAPEVPLVVSVQPESSVREGSLVPEDTPGDSGVKVVVLPGTQDSQKIPCGQEHLVSQESVPDSQDSVIPGRQFPGCGDATFLEEQRRAEEEKRKRKTVVKRLRQEEARRVEAAERYKAEMEEADEWLRLEAEKEAEELSKSSGKDFQTVSVKRKIGHSGGFPKVSKSAGDSLDVSDRYGTLRDLIKDEMATDYDEPPEPDGSTIDLTR